MSLIHSKHKLGSQMYAFQNQTLFFLNMTQNNGL